MAPDRVPFLSRLDAMATVGTVGLFADLMRRAGAGESLDETILSAGHRRAHPVAHAEHFHWAAHRAVGALGARVVVRRRPRAASVRARSRRR
jgi:hypothetical protein